MEDSSMRIGDRNPKDNQQKSSGSLNDQPKKERKGLCLLDKLIVAIVAGTLGYVGITFVNCNFMIPGSIQRANSLGGLVNPPPLDCKESESKAYNAIFTLLTTVIALKTKMDT